MQSNANHRAIGIHVAGSNAQKSAVVVLNGDPLRAPLAIQSFHDRIGSSGNFFSDDRILSIIEHSLPAANIFVDCPITVPPCVSCMRPVCPGVIACEDISVAYMMAQADALRRSGGKRRRPINPQSQRLWDISYVCSRDDGFEPTYSANHAPVIFRARALKKRLMALGPEIQLRETSVSHCLGRILEYFALDSHDRFRYRNFELGADIRSRVLKALRDLYWIDLSSVQQAQLVKSVELFQAYIAALTAFLATSNLATQPPVDFPEVDGWVFLPLLRQELKMPRN